MFTGQESTPLRMSATHLVCIDADILATLLLDAVTNRLRPLRAKVIELQVVNGKVESLACQFNNILCMLKLSSILY